MGRVDAMILACLSMYEVGMGECQGSDIGRVWFLTWVVDVYFTGSCSSRDWGPGGLLGVICDMESRKTLLESMWWKLES